MNIVEPSFKIVKIDNKDDILAHLELAARNCYKSEDKIQPGSAKTLLKALVKSGHHSIIEHSGATVRIVCDRGILAEITRHRLASFSVESSRYCNYNKDKFNNEITVIKPCFWKTNSLAFQIWKETMMILEARYFALLEQGANPQEARSVLPNSLKTEIVMTCNFREWRTIFQQRCSPKAHPQIRQIMIPLLKTFKTIVPVLFDDI